MLSRGPAEIQEHSTAREPKFSQCACQAVFFRPILGLPEACKYLYIRSRNDAALCDALAFPPALPLLLLRLPAVRRPRPRLLQLCEWQESLRWAAGLWNPGGLAAAAAGGWRNCGAGRRRPAGRLALWPCRPSKLLSHASAGDPAVQGEFDLSLSADGLLAAMLMLGLMLSAPTCSQLSRHVPVMRLLSGGLRQVQAAMGLPPVMWPHHSCQLVRSCCLCYLFCPVECTAGSLVEVCTSCALPCLHASMPPCSQALPTPLPAPPCPPRFGMQPLGAGSGGLCGCPHLPRPAALPIPTGHRSRAFHCPGTASDRRPSATAEEEPVAGNSVPVHTCGVCQRLHLWRPGECGCAGTWASAACGQASIACVQGSRKQQPTQQLPQQQCAGCMGGNTRALDGDRRAHHTRQPPAAAGDGCYCWLAGLPAQVGTAYGWRAAFAIEAAAMLPLATLALLATPVELHGSKAAAATGGK